MPPGGRGEGGGKGPAGERWEENVGEKPLCGTERRGRTGVYILVSVVVLLSALLLLLISAPLTTRGRRTTGLTLLGYGFGEGVWVVLEKAHLRYAKIGSQLSLLNAQDHADYLVKHDEDPKLYRPDIVHQALMAVLDSPLNKAGRIKGIYVHTTDNHIIYVSPSARLPRMFRRFCQMMVEVMQRMRIKSKGSGKKLLKLVRGPLLDHLPLGSTKIAFSYQAGGEPVDFFKYAKIPEDDPLVIAVGAMAQGHILNETEKYMLPQTALRISSYPLSAACALSRILTSLERQCRIL